MKSKIFPTVIAFALISALNTCHSYNVKRESKVGKTLSESAQKLEEESLFVPVDDKEFNNNVEKITYSKGK